MQHEQIQSEAAVASAVFSGFAVLISVMALALGWYNFEHERLKDQKADEQITAARQVSYAICRENESTPGKDGRYVSRTIVQLSNPSAYPAKNLRVGYVPLTPTSKCETRTTLRHEQEKRDASGDRLVVFSIDFLPARSDSTFTIVDRVESYPINIWTGVFTDDFPLTHWDYFGDVEFVESEWGRLWHNKTKSKDSESPTAEHRKLNLAECEAAAKPVSAMRCKNCRRGVDWEFDWVAERPMG